MSAGEVLAALEAGEVVAVPTDTVYGLAARIDRPRAVAGIFDLKGRPPDLALPVLLGSERQVGSVAATWDATAVAVSSLWPGPLTLIVPAVSDLGALLGSSNGTVGIRVPGHRVVQDLCLAAGPLAVTSANRHGAPPCTTADEVRTSFPSILVMNGGRCDGTPSTVVDCTTTPPTCVRDGGVAWSEVEAALGQPGPGGREPGQ